MRTEHDFLGEMNVPDDVYYGVQTMRALEISILQAIISTRISFMPWRWSKKQPRWQI